MQHEITRTFDLLDHLVENYPKDDILCGKVGKEWVRYSSHDYYKYAHYLAYGFCEMGYKPGDRIITISGNCPEWNFCDMALAMCGLIHVPVYPTLSADNYLHIFQHSEARAIFVNNKVLLSHIKPALDKMEKQPDIFTLMPIEGRRNMLEILKAGIANRDKYMSVIEARKESIKPDDWMSLIYTSGTTGAPKGVMLSHRNICSNFLAHSKVSPMDSSYTVLSFLPLNHVFERSMNYHYQYKGQSIYYAESMGTIMQNIAEVHARSFCAVPRVMEMMYDKLYAAGKDLKGIRKKIYSKAFKHGERFDYGIVKKMSLWYQIKQYFYDRMVYSKWREKFGGNRFIIISGGSGIQPRLVRLFAAAGFNIYEGYGLSETAPVIAVNNPADGLVRIGTVGPVLSGTECKIADDGEILTRGPHVMLGYYKDPEYTRQVIDDEGWFHTGDVGVFVANRYLKITDRKKDIFKLSAGKYIAPQVLENKMRESQYIDQVLVVGENEKFASAIISPNFNTLHYWALKHKLHYRDNSELIALPEVKAKMQSIINEMNPQFAPHEQIKQIRLVSEEWTTANGMLSPTLKVKRNVLIAKYKTLIAQIYGKEDEQNKGWLSAFRQIELPSINIGGKKKNE
ncbi:MAG: long-chain fatty acid--CoA ligase [Bacteroidales bacterium]|nr:long-chain fatty acid--CoA ligase [Bacteroidales bacterium]